MRFNWLARIGDCFISSKHGRNRVRRSPVITEVEFLERRIVFAAAYSQFADPHPVNGNQFGATVTPLSTGNVVVTAPGDDTGGSNAGAVYVFDGSTGDLISTIIGSHANDAIGSGGVTPLTDGNFVFSSPTWSNGIYASVGAVTWGSGTTGVGGVVGATNSLVGASLDDFVGQGGITPLSNGNYVVQSPAWTNGTNSFAGAVTWGRGNTGVSGVVSPTNSLVGRAYHDEVGNNIKTTEGTTYPGVIELTNGNYVVDSPRWNFDTPVDPDYRQEAGAVTWGDGASGITGTINVGNSLIGGSANDYVGLNGITILSNGNYVVTSGNWNNGSATSAGAVTWGSGSTGVDGIVSDQNSLVGTSAGDTLGVAYPTNPGRPSYANLVIALDDGNYVVDSPAWAHGAIPNAGASTFGNGDTGVVGEISATNSLIGDSAGDKVGLKTTELTNGNYVVESPLWNNGSVLYVGAATLGNGETGVTGVVSEDNSLVGGSYGDEIGNQAIVPLTNGNYVVDSPYWHNAGVANAGAITLGNGVTPTVGVVGMENSLIGSLAGDSVGYNGEIIPLTNGNYVMDDPFWSNGQGAVTWGNGTSGVTGLVSGDNSLIGNVRYDLVGNGSVIALSNGNYVVGSPGWTAPWGYQAGAVTWGDGTTGVHGVITSANSLVGDGYQESLSQGVYLGPHNQPPGLFALPNGNYVIASPKWNNGQTLGAGAVTWANGLTGITGRINSTNSLVGSSAGDKIGSNGITILQNGNFVVDSPFWDNDGVTDAGAVTWGSATTGVTGVVSSENSLVGSSATDEIGSQGITTLSNGNYSINSPDYDFDAASSSTQARALTSPGSVRPAVAALIDAGAVTFGHGDTGVDGTITTSNSSIGSTASSGLASVTSDNVNHTFYSPFINSNGGVVSVGSQVSGFINTAPTAVTLKSQVSSLPDSTSTSSDVKVAEISVADDALGTNILSLSGLDAASFEIVGSSLFLKAGTQLSVLTKTSYSVTVSVTDQTFGPSPDASVDFSLTITQQPPQVGGFTTPVNYVENSSAVLVGAAVTVTDVDQSNFDNGIVTVSLAANAESADRLGIRNQGVLAGQIGVTGTTITFGGTDIGTFSGGIGASPLTVNLNANATPFASQALLRNVTYSNVSDNPSALARTVGISVSDGQGRTSDPVTKTINVIAVNDPPTLSNIESLPLNYIENSAGIHISASIKLTDPDSTLLQGAIVAITANYQATADTLSFVNTGKISGAWNPALGRLTLTGSDTVADYLAAIKSVTYRNLSDNPSALPRTVAVRATDGTYGNIVSRNINVTAVNDPPHLSGIETVPLVYHVNLPALKLTSSILASDPDNTTLAGATIWISGNDQKNLDLLSFTNTATISGVWDPVAGNLKLTGHDTVADYSIALRSILFHNSSNTPSLYTRTISFQVTDGAAVSNTVTQFVTFVDAPPVLSSAESSPISYPRATSAVAVTSSLRVSDTDSPNLVGATVRIVNFQAGDLLQFVNTQAINASFNSATGVLTLTGTATEADYQQALRSVKFSNPSIHASTVTRTIAFQVSDGLLRSNVALRSVTIH